MLTPWTIFYFEEISSGLKNNMQTTCILPPTTIRQNEKSVHIFFNYFFWNDSWEENYVHNNLQKSETLHNAGFWSHEKQVLFQELSVVIPACYSVHVP